jgi:hypothetical protein
MFTALFASTIILINSYTPVTLSEHQISLSQRQPDRYINQVFKDNILLNVAYLENRVINPSDIDWVEVNKPYSYQFSLRPGETFAFHDTVLEKYQGKVVKTGNAHFIGIEGFKHDGYLMGDGVCHLASLFYWVGKDAGLEVEALANHDFAVINEIPKENSKAVYYDPFNRLNSARQNVYITNNKDYPINFVIVYDGENLKLTATQGI